MSTRRGSLCPPKSFYTPTKRGATFARQMTSLLSSEEEIEGDLDSYHLMLKPTDNNKNQRIHSCLFSTQFTIGTAISNTLTLTGYSTSGISRYHIAGCINPFLKEIFIKDLSSNGTYINDHRIQKSVGSESLADYYNLKNGDILRLGSLTNESGCEFKIYIRAPLLYDDVLNSNYNSQNCLPHQKILVQGYIKQRNKELSETITYIPSSIANLIFKYYKLYACFRSRGRYMHLARENIAATTTNRVTGTLLDTGFILDHRISFATIYTWTIKINHVHYDKVLDKETEIFFGIIQKPPHQMEPNRTVADSDLNFQDYYKSSGIFLSRKIWYDTRYDFETLPKNIDNVIHIGDTFTLQLDIKTRKMRFWINDEIYWNWRSIQKMNNSIYRSENYQGNAQEYWMIISLYKAEWTKIELLNYNEC